jgi:hypothetical protein
LEKANKQNLFMVRSERMRGNPLGRKLTSTSRKYKQTPWPESTSELYRQSGRRLSAKLVPTFADRGWHVVSVTDPYVRILGFLYRVTSTCLGNTALHSQINYRRKPQYLTLIKLRPELLLPSEMLF